MSDDKDSVDDLLNRDWTGDVLSRVDGLVDTVHDRAIIPVVTGVRALVFGLLIVLMSLICVILLAIVLVRVLNNYAFDHRVWASYASVGAIFFLMGSFAWMKRKPKAA